jgi:hypothetical protein
MSLNDFLTHPKTYLVTLSSAAFSSIADYFSWFDSASFAAVCAGLLSLALIYCHVRKSNAEKAISRRDEALRDIEIARQQLRLKQERDFMAGGGTFKRASDILEVNDEQTRG